MITHADIALHNVAELEPAPGEGLFLRRFPSRVRTALSRLGRMVAEDAAGVELRFATASPNFRLSLGSLPTFLTPHERHGQEVVILRGAHVHSIHRLEPGRINHIHVTELGGPDPVVTRPAPAKGRAGFAPQVWRILLGRYPAIFFNLETFGETRRPPTADETPARRWLAYGSSITNGASPGLHLNSYVYHAARIAGVDVLNQGLSGSCLCEPAVADYLGTRDDADIVTLEIGVNMRMSFTPEQFRERAARLLDAVTAKAGRRVALVTAFPNIATPENAARQDAFCEILRKLHASGRWPGLELIEGGEVLDDIGDLSTDLIHPSDYGHARMGQRLGERLASLFPPPSP
ncbi:MAG: GDSL-type esterase/lipase family protein [Verrucomicrobiota bacterium]